MLCCDLRFFVRFDISMCMGGKPGVDRSLFWRVNLAFIILILTVVSAFFVKPKIKPFILFFLIFIFPIIGFVLIHGGFGLENVETRVWGGLSLTFMLTFFGIIFAETSANYNDRFKSD